MRLWRYLMADRFLVLLVIAGALLALGSPFEPAGWYAAIDWRTLLTLAGLLLLTKGVELSGYFDVLGRRLARRLTTERALAIFLVCAAGLLATFLTNDVALFIVIPLTLTLKKWCALPVNRLIIFQALAVNAGSLLTPVGNPQNILLWGHQGLSFGAFIWQMAPLCAVVMLTLILLCWWAFPGRALRFTAAPTSAPWQPRLLTLCAGLYLLFLITLQSGYAAWGLVAVVVALALAARVVLVQVDWRLLLIFIAMFIDVHLITRLPGLSDWLEHSRQLGIAGQLILGAGLSQIISNVPATILLLNYYPANALLAWSVNIGGFGLFMGSLANLIALRMAADRRIWWQFHIWSLPMLLWSLGVGYLLMRL